MSKRYIIINSHPIQYFAPLYAYLAKRSLDIQVWYCSKHGIDVTYDREFDKSFKWDIDLLSGYEHKFLKNVFGKGPHGFFHILNPGVLRQLAKAPKSTVVIHGWRFATNWIALVGCKLFGHKIALKAETPVNQVLNLRSIKFKILNFLLFKRMDEIHVIGSLNQQLFEKFGISKSRFISTPYSVDNERFEVIYKSLLPQRFDLRNRLGVSQEEFVFIISGKLIPKKRPLDVLSAIMELEPEIARQTKFVFMGDGQLREEMGNIIEKNRISNVHFTGFINQSQIGEYYSIADCYIMSSGVGETWGLSTNEAMNFSLPIIVSTTSGCSADLVNDNGYTFETGNFASLANCITSYVKLSKELKNKMKSRSIEIIQNFSFETIYQNMSN